MDIKNHPSLTTGLVCYYGLNGGVNDYHDSIPGTAEGSPSYSSAYRVRGAYGISLNGSSQRVTLGTPGALQLANYVSVSAWVYATVAPIFERGIVTKGATTGVNRAWGLEVIGNPGKWSFWMNNGTSDFMAQDPANALANTWVHLAAYVDSSAGEVHLFKNGIRVASNYLLLGTINPTPTIHTLFGAMTDPANIPNGRVAHWAGYLDEIGIWNRVLTAAEIADLYSGGGGLDYENLERGLVGVELTEAVKKMVPVLNLGKGTILSRDQGLIIPKDVLPFIGVAGLEKQPLQEREQGNVILPTPRKRLRS